MIDCVAKVACIVCVPALSVYCDVIRGRKALRSVELSCGPLGFSSADLQARRNIWGVMWCVRAIAIVFGLALAMTTIYTSREYLHALLTFARQNIG